MREYAVRLKKLGISYDRYRELVHFCRQYDQLGEEQQEWIRQAARMVSEEYWETLVESICKGEAGV